MKLPYQQLEAHLAKTLAPIYLVSGDEILLTQEAMDLIRNTAIKAGYSERIRISPESGSDWSQSLSATGQNFSLFATKRILELDLRNAKLNQTHSAALQAYAKLPPSDTVLLISIHKLDSKSEQSAWYKAFEKNGITIPIWPVPPEQLPQWIIQRAKKINLTLSPANATWLAEQAEGNLLAAAQEIEKLNLLQTNNTLDTALIEAAVSDNAHYDIFALVECTLAGNKKRALRILKNLEAEDIEPTLILWAITRELRMLIDMMQQTKQGTPLSQLFNQYRIWEKRQTGMRAYLQRQTPEKSWHALSHAATIDRMIKGAEKGHVRNQIEQLILEML